MSFALKLTLLFAVWGVGTGLIALGRIEDGYKDTGGFGAASLIAFASASAAFLMTTI